MTYSISGKQAVMFHTAHLSKAPTIQNSFPNARLNNSIVNGLSNETHSSIEASYLYRTPIIKVRATAYYLLPKKHHRKFLFLRRGHFR